VTLSVPLVASFQVAELTIATPFAAGVATYVVARLLALTGR
jgi:hypothetical protein